MKRWPLYLVVRGHEDDPPTHLSDHAVRKYLTAYWSNARVASRTAIWDAMSSITSSNEAALLGLGAKKARELADPRDYSWAVYRLYGGLGPTGVEGKLGGLLVYVRPKGARYGRWLVYHERPDVPSTAAATVRDTSEVIS